MLALVTLALVQGDRGETVSPTTAPKYAHPPLVTPRPDESKVAAAHRPGRHPGAQRGPARESDVTVAVGSAFDPAPTVAAKRTGQQYDGAIGSSSQGERDAAFVRNHQRGGR